MKNKSSLLLFTGFALLLGSSRTQAQRATGIDVSTYQGSGVNWGSVKGAGFTFAWAKATEGTGFTDSTYAGNISRGKTAGMFMGGYDFAHPLNTPSAEAGHFWSVTAGNTHADAKTLMPMLDMEVFTGVNGASSYSDWVNQWCNIIKNDAAGQSATIKPVIYFSACHGGNFNSSISQWCNDIANYNGQSPQSGTPWDVCASQDPWGSSIWHFWQWTSTVTVPGISGNVDHDVYHGTLSTLKAVQVAGSPASGPTAPTPPLRYNVDVNGDGKTDVVLIWNNGGTATIRTSLSLGTSFASATDVSAGISFGTLGVTRQWIPMDVNGDGKTDIVLIWKNGTSASARAYLSTGTGFTTGADAIIAGTYGTMGVDRQYLKGDVNGDGKEDLIMIWNNGGGGYARVCPSSGTGFSIGLDTSIAGGFGTLGVDRQWIPADINGDGKTDLIMIWDKDGDADARPCLSTGTNFTVGVDATVAGTFGTLGDDRLWMKGDVNGDGKEDLIMIWDNDGGAYARICPSSGTGYSIGTDTSIAGTYGTLGVDRQWIPLDVNGDGKKDLVMIWNKTGDAAARACLSSGTNFSVGADVTLAGTFGTIGVDRDWLKGDVTGDGKEDIIMIWNNSGVGDARICPSSGTAYLIGTDTVVCGTFGTIGVDRCWLPPGL